MKDGYHHTICGEIKGNEKVKKISTPTLRAEEKFQRTFVKNNQQDHGTGRRKTAIIEELQKLCSDDTKFLTQHLVDRVKERGIKYSDFKAVLINGDIIEQYKDDTLFPAVK